MSTVRTRFAPSPTGSLHVGGARTALYCWLFSRKHEGQFILRIEDTDQRRSSEESARGIIRDMQWLGLDWDEGPGVGGPFGPYFQSQRLDRYDTHYQALVESDSAYEAWESREELDALRKEAEANKENFRFRRTDPYTEAELHQYREVEKRTPVGRLRTPQHDFTVEDLVRGEVSQRTGEVEDVVIRKGDGFPTYHFAVVVDDHHMQITHVMRGGEHMMNTHKHLAILERLGWTSPKHAHLPTIMNMSGGKMSKRDKAKRAREAAREEAKNRGAAKGEWSWLAEAVGTDSEDLTLFMKKKHGRVELAEKIAEHLGVELPMIDIMEFRQGGFLAEAMLNYLALLGWSAGDDRENYTLPELVEAFTIERVNKQDAKFDIKKLLAMNADHLRAISDERYMEALGQWMEVVDTPLSRLTDADLKTVVELFRTRARTFVELQTMSHFLRAAPRTYEPKAVKKFIFKGGGLQHLTDARTALSDVGRWEADSIKKTITRLTESTGMGMGKYAQPLRVAISGSAATPSLFETLAALDREDALARIDRALETWNDA